MSTRLQEAVAAAETPFDRACAKVREALVTTNKVWVEHFVLKVGAWRILAADTFEINEAAHG